MDSAFTGDVSIQDDFYDCKYVPYLAESQKRDLTAAGGGRAAPAASLRLRSGCGEPRVVAAKHARAIGDSH